MIRIPHLNSIRMKFVMLFFVFGAVLLGSLWAVMLTIITRMEETLIADRLLSDIHYIEDLIAEGEDDVYWNVRNDAIYLGSVLVGDGTEQHANLEPFLKHERRSGTFSYVFIKCSDDLLGYVPDTPTQKGYQQGHYYRVAGSTRDPNGKSIVGTYISKEVADALDEYDTYGGEANVAGGMIYCRYNTLKDHDGTVVGGIVVGRNVSELRSHINQIMRNIVVGVIMAILLAGTVLFLLVSGWTKMISKIVVHVREIEEGGIPDRALVSNSHDEMDELVSGINHMTDSLREKEALRKKSETDQLTGIANRFGLNRYFEEVFEKCYREQKNLAVGIMDIDSFKPFNDNYGHQAGDKCIVMLADILKGLEGQDDIFCARYGGDEFIVISVGRTPDELSKIAQDIKAGVLKENMPHEYSKTASCVTISQGYCYGIPRQHKKLTDYIYAADSALYDVKESTKNHFKIIEMTDDFRPIFTEGGNR